MREGWREVALGEVTDVVMGQSPPGSSYNDGAIGMPFIQGSAEFGLRNPSPTKWCSDPRKVAQPGDLLLSVRAPVGELNFAHVPLAIGRGLAVLRGQSHCSTPFLGHALEHRRPLLRSRSAGGMFESTTRAGLTGLPILLPPLGEQRRIVDLIAAVDEAIEAADLAANRAQHCRTSAVTATMSTRAVSGASGATSPPWVRLGAVVHLDIERVAVAEHCSYRIAGVLNAGKGLLERPPIDGSETNYPALQRLRTGQLVMRKLTAWEGPITVVPQLFDGAYVSPEFPTFTLDQRQILPGYLRHICTSPVLWAAMQDGSTGSVQRRKRVNPARLLEIPIPLPPLDDQTPWVDLLDSLGSLEVAARENADRLTRLRSSLLADLLSGEHEIPASYDELLTA
jgi:type I restriction enzyme S subunit